MVESVPIHEDIKTHSGSFVQYTENYKVSLQNLAKEGIRTVCYNVMPVLDWTRTELNHRVKDGSGALRFDWVTLCAFDLCILSRKNAEADYSENVITQAKKWYQQSSSNDQDILIKTMVAGLPGSDQGFDFGHFKNALARYHQITPSS